MAQSDTVRSVDVLAESTVDFDSLTVCSDLIRDRALQDKSSVQVTIVVQACSVSLKRKPNLTRVRAGFDQEIIFQLACIAVINQINTAIESPRPKVAEVRNPATPLGRIVTDENAGGGAQLLDAL